jgi:endonuclease/exonuclease/phosphatase family metal-dependent hydrolase
MAKPGPAITFLASWTLSLGIYAAPPEAINDEAPNVLTVATLNLAHGRGLAVDQLGLSREQYETNIDAVAAVVRRESPEVLAVQEADAASAWSGHFDHVARLAKLGTSSENPFSHVHHGLHLEAALVGVQVRSGTALLAKRPIASPASYTFTANKTHAKGFVTGEIEFDGRGLILASIHLASGSKDIRRQQAEQITATLRPKRAAMVLMGDFNSTWGAKEDALRLIASSLKLNAYEPASRELATFRANRPRTRIDWILISVELEFVDYCVWPDQVSDHLAVAAKLRWRLTG